MNDTIHEAIIIDGKSYAEKMRKEIATYVTNLKTNHNLIPGLAVVRVGDDPASVVYVRNKGKQAQEVGMLSSTYELPESTTEKQLLAKIDNLNNDPKVHGILVQLPLPDHITEKNIINAVDPLKDVDGFHPMNMGKLLSGQRDGLIPCTPLGCLILIKEYLGDIAGKNALVIGRSNIVGKPVAALLLREHCTVTIAHSKTKDLPAECEKADIVVAAVGIPKMVRARWIKPGACVIDVGINRVVGEDGKAKLIGDVNFDIARHRAGHITPVPGGVGPMTIACLLRNTVKAACVQRNIELDEIGFRRILA